MPATLAGQLVVAISSRALFDFEEENEHFEAHDDRAYMQLQLGVFTRGGTPWRYLKPLAANLFLSANEADVRSALEAGVPAARVYPHSARASDAHPQEVRIAFDGDAVLFSDEAERVYQEGGLDAFQAHERAQAETPLAAGPFQPLLLALHRLQNEPAHG